jgi:hypothetical protein
MEQHFLDNTTKQFQYYKSLGDKTLRQLSWEDACWQFDPESNSIAIIVKHLWGNMRSRWTDFLTTDGEKDWRSRDAEFENDFENMDVLLAKWEEGWACLFQALDSVNAGNFHQIVYIRNQGHTIVEAINRQLAHYAYHVGQIVYIGKMCKGSGWENLSIPKGKSEDFNREKFSQPKRQEHFTREFLEEK